MLANKDFKQIAEILTASGENVSYHAVHVQGLVRDTRILYCSVCVHRMNVFLLCVVLYPIPGFLVK